MKKINKLFMTGLLAGLCSIANIIPEAKAEATNKPFRGLCYGPFREGQSPNWGIYPSAGQIRDDITNKLVFLTGKIRLYGNENTLSNIPSFCNQYNLDCYPAAWIDNVAEDNNQVSRLIQTGNANFSTTKGLIVGTEFLYRNPSSFSTLTNFLKQVKSATGKQVTACEQWHIYRDYPGLTNAVDFIMINIHPYWEGQNVTNAANFVLDRYNFIKNKYPGKKIIIGETGWPSSGPAYGDAVPSIDNQKRFMIDFRKIAKENGIDYMFFEAFDEPWKGEGGVGGNWGSLDKNRNLKQSMIDYVAENTFFTSVHPSKITLQTYEGDRYSLERNYDLKSTNWANITNFIGTAGTNNTSINLPPTTNRNFFLRAKLNL